jgi:serine/threonine protein phosphatase PrpC
MSEKKTRTALKLTAKTDVGRVREHNEDNYVVCPDVEKKEWFFSDTIIESEEGTLLVVADGMGGLNAGEVASAIAIETIQQYFNQDNRTKIETHEQVKAALIDCINIAQSNMLNHAKEHPDTTGMGTTIVIAFIKENILHTAWVGDSRCYVLRKNTELYYATKDHSYVQELVDANQLTMEQAFYHPESNIITRSLGDNSNKTPKPDVCAYPIVAGDKILLCSDGLNGMLQDDAILKILHETENINEAAIKLINTANEAGGHDNITLILSEIISVSNETFPDNIKLRAMELAVNFNQLDSGNPFQTLKPIKNPDHGNDDEVVNDTTSSNSGSKKKNRRILIVTLLVIISLICIGMIFYQKLSTGKIELKKNPTVNAISDSARAIIKEGTNDSNSIERGANKKINSNLQKKEEVKRLDTTKKSVNPKLPKNIEKKENKTLNLTPINE